MHHEILPIFLISKQNIRRCVDENVEYLGRFFILQDNFFTNEENSHFIQERKQT